jgi:DNA repair exonuclease SbcCD nuclease subunit
MIVLASDYHIGKILKSHSSEKSRQALQARLVEQVRKVVEHAKREDAFLICGGDLFDRFQNSEKIVLEGFELAKHHDLVLTGNHDMRNNSELVSSADLIKAVLGKKVCKAPEFDRPYYEVYTTKAGTDVVAVPHHLTQELFEHALLDAAEYAKESDAKLKIIVLHCNYELSFEASDSTLNLTRDLARQLLDSGFDYIFMGHEHAPAKHLGGRLVVMGNTHPTSFADISDKYFYTLDEETGELEKHVLWKESKNFKKLDVLDLDDYIASDEIHEFVQIEGHIKAEQLPSVNKQLLGLWRAKPDMFAAKPSYEVEGRNVDKKVNLKSMDALPDVIMNELSGDMKELFAEILGEVK